MTDLKYSEVSAFMRKVWNEDGKSLDQREADFMKAMKDIMFWLVTDSGEGEGSYNPMDSAYDATVFLNAVDRAIEAYKEIYHIVDVSCQWSKADDKEDEK